MWKIISGTTLALVLSACGRNGIIISVEPTPTKPILVYESIKDDSLKVSFRIPTGWIIDKRGTDNFSGNVTQYGIYDWSKLGDLSLRIDSTRGGAQLPSDQIAKGVRETYQENSRIEDEITGVVDGNPAGGVIYVRSLSGSKKYGITFLVTTRGRIYILQLDSNLEFDSTLRRMYEELIASIRFID